MTSFGQQKSAEVVKMSNKPILKYLSELVRDDDIPSILTSERAKYARLQAIGSVSDILERKCRNIYSTLIVCFIAGILWKMLCGGQSKDQRSIGM